MSRLSPRRRWLPGLLLMSVCLGDSARANSLVTRDDFLCYDTSRSFHPNGKWPYVALDGAGNISEINYISDPRAYQYTRFDKLGNQSQSVIQFLPDSTNPDTAWKPWCATVISCNETGEAFIPYNAQADGYCVKRVFGLLADSVGGPLKPTLCFTCESEFTDCEYKGIPDGDINVGGVAGLVWMQWNAGPPDSTFAIARLFYAGPDTLGPVIKPCDLPHPLAHLPGYEDYDVFNEPQIGIADDGGFVIAWIAVFYMPGALNKHVYYSVYNSEGTPTSGIRTADCPIDVQDSSECVTKDAHHIGLAVESDGDFYIVWTDYLGPYYWIRRHLWLRGFHADGLPKYDAIRITDSDSLWLHDAMIITPSVSCDDSGNVLVVWPDARLHPGSTFGSTFRDVFAQKVDPAGNLVGPNYRLNNNFGYADPSGVGTTGDVNNAGQAVVAWCNTNTTLRVSAQLMPYHDIGTFVPGDINSDLSGNVADLITLTGYLFQGEPNSFWPRDLTDFDGSSGTNVADLVYFVDYLFFGGPLPQTPYDGIRPDPGPPWE